MTDWTWQHFAAVTLVSIAALAWAVWGDHK